MKAYRWKGIGRKLKNRMNLAKAFIAKAIFIISKLQTSSLTTLEDVKTLDAYAAGKILGKFHPNPPFHAHLLNFLKAVRPKRFTKPWSKSITVTG
jgi:hypothetical protein